MCTEIIVHLSAMYSILSTGRRHAQTSFVRALSVCTHVVRRGVPFDGDGPGVGADERIHGVLRCGGEDAAGLVQWGEHRPSHGAHL